MAKSATTNHEHPANSRTIGPHPETVIGIHRPVFIVRSYIQDRLKHDLKKSRTNQRVI